MRFRPLSQSLPLGVDLGQRSISVVATRTTRQGFAVRAAHAEDVPEVPHDRRERAMAELLRDIVARLEGNERRCVLCAPSNETVVRTFRLPPGMSRREAERAAWLEADALVEWSATERLVAIEPIPGCADRMLLSVARSNSVRRLAAIARAAGLRPIAVDAAVCAWRRAVGDADAVLDCSGDRAELVVFGTPVGISHVFAPRLIDERLAAQTRSAFVDARRDGLADVRRLAILGTPLRYEVLADQLRDDGCRVAPVHVGDVAAPPWALAYGLASWSLAPTYTVAS